MRPKKCEEGRKEEVARVGVGFCNGRRSTGLELSLFGD